MSNNTRVHFLEDVTVWEIESRGDYSKQEILNSFYTSDELANIALRSFKEASRTGCIRGLETYTKQGHDQSVKDIERCRDAVMDEQDIQWATGEGDYHRLAAASQEASKFNVAKALKRGAEDEQEAQRIYQLMEKQTISTSAKSLPKPPKRTKTNLSARV